MGVAAGNRIYHVYRLSIKTSKMKVLLCVSANLNPVGLKTTVCLSDKILSQVLSFAMIEFDHTRPGIWNIHLLS